MSKQDDGGMAPPMATDWKFDPTRYDGHTPGWYFSACYGEAAEINAPIPGMAGCYWIGTMLCTKSNHGKANAALAVDAPHLLALAQEQAAEIERLESEVADYRSGVDLRHEAQMRAVRRWQAATGKERVFPDHADLCVWLIEQLEACEAEVERLAAMVEDVEWAISCEPCVPHATELGKRVDAVVSQMRDELAALQKSGGWVPCSERMPTAEDGDVRGMVMAYRSGDRGPYFIEWDSDYIMTYTHWRPIVLPEVEG